MKKILLTFVLLLSTPSHVFAGGFVYNLTNGDPARWTNPSDIRLSVESGSCGDFSNSQMIDILNDAIATWENASEADINFTVTTGEIGNITAENYVEAYFGYEVSCSDEDGDGTEERASECNSTSTPSSTYFDFNPIVFDTDGEIHQQLYGYSNLASYLGAARVVGYNSDSEISRGALLINCLCMQENPPTLDTDGDGTPDDEPCSRQISSSVDLENLLSATIKHELGHFLNLDHSYVNHDLISDNDSSNDNDTPLMYPLLTNYDRDFELKQDDKVTLGQLYPSSSFEDDYCILTGTILDRSENELQCASINGVHNSNAEQSVGYVSGVEAAGRDLNGDSDTVDYVDGSYESTSGRGEFKLYLKPGEIYEITISDINSTFTSGKQIYPCINEQLPACTDEIIASCYDEDNRNDCDVGNTACDACSACVDDQVLISSSTYEQTYLPLCAGGQTINAGNFLTASVSFETSVDINGGVVSSSSGTDSSGNDGTGSVSSGTEGACQLTLSSEKNSSLFWTIGLSLLALMTLRRSSCKKKA